LAVASPFAFAFYHKYNSPPAPYDFESMRGKNKTIVIVGGGMVGLTSAYILAKNYPKNDVVLLERNSKPLGETSR